MKPTAVQTCEAASGTSLVSVRVVRGLVEAVECAGASRAAFLAKVRFDAEQLDSTSRRLQRSELYRLFELAMDMARDPAFGLHWCERLSDSVFNPISQLIRHAATLREGLDTLARFHGLLAEPAGFEVVERPDRVTIYTSELRGESLRLRRFVAEMLVTGFVRILRAFSPRARADLVAFSYAAPDYRDEYTRVIGQPANFEQAFTGIVFNASLMDLPSPHKDKDLHAAMRSIAERRILQVNQQLPFSWRVRDYLVHQGANRNDAHMPRVARALGMSTRSLRRRLNDEGKSFNDLVHDASASVAIHLIRDKRWSIQEAAYEMGFASTTTFHRAFKRWTGTTPKEFREQSD